MKIGDKCVVERQIYREVRGEKEFRTVTGTIVSVEDDKVAVKYDIDVSNADGNIGIASKENVMVLKVPVEPKIIKKIIKETHFIKEIYTSSYKTTWVDSLYNWYCRLKGRDIDSVIEGDTIEKEV